MSTFLSSEKIKTPLWFWGAAILGLLWNSFGLAQFLGSLSATSESLQAQGMTVDQAAVMLGYPLWMTVAFGVGVALGLLGSGLLLMRKSLARPVFAVSLLGYIALYVGDIVHGVFAALGAPQIIILTVVVAIAVLLLWLAHFSEKRGIIA